MKNRLKLLFVFLYIVLCTSTIYAERKISVLVEGVSGDMLHHVLGNISLEQLKRSDLLTDRYMLYLYSLAPDEIRQALEAFGYYNPKISTTLEYGKKRFTARFTIDKGLPVLVAIIEVHITGAGAAEPFFKAFTFPFTVGDIFNHKTYEDAKKTLRKIASEYGFLDAEFLKNEVLLEKDLNLCTIRLHFDTGRRYYFGKITVHQEIFAPSFINRFIRIKGKEPYESSKLLNLRKDLSNSDYFSSIDIETSRKKADTYLLPLEITLLPLKKYKFYTGAGYGTDTGPRASIGWDNRRINRYGHRFRSKYSISPVRTGITGIYEIPLENPVTDSISAQSGWKRETTDTSESKVLTFSVKRRKGLGKGWIYSVFTDYQEEFFTVGQIKTRTRLIIPGIDFSRTLARNLVFPVRGSNLSLECKGTDRALGSDIGMLSTKGSAKIIRTLLFEHRLLLRGEAGYIDASDFDQLPSSLRFFTGGDNSVRGYAYQSLGPMDANGDVIGGRYLVVGSAEYEYKIFRKWHGAFFYDVGNAFHDIRDDFRKAFGCGIRWRSPVGPIRIDIAFPIREPKRNFRIHINMEPDL